MENPVGIGPLLGHCAHLAKERMDTRLIGFDVTPAQMRTLLYLHCHGGQAPQHEITAFLKVKPSTVAGILDRMEEKELVARSINNNDARRRTVTLTSKGQEQQACFLNIFQEIESLMLQNITDEEAAILQTLLERIIKNMEGDRTEC